MPFKKQKEISGHAGAIYTVVATNKYIYSGSADKYVARWLIEEGIQDKFAIQFEQSVYAMEMLSDNLLAVGLSDGALHIFDLNERKELKHFVQHKKGIFSIKFNSVAKQFYVGDADGNLSIWNVDLEQLIYLPLNCGKIRSIDVSRDGKYFVAACQDGSLRVFDTIFFNEVKTIQAHENGSTSVLFHPLKDNQLISGGKDALLKLWNWQDEKELKSVVAHTFSIYAIQSIRNGTLIMTSSRDKNVKLWNSENLSFLKRLDFKEGGHKYSVNDLAKIDENTIVSSGDDKRMIIWEAE